VILTHHLALAAASAAAVPATADPASTYLAPGGLGLTLVAGLGFAAREYAKGRRERVSEADARAAKEKTRADAAELERDKDVTALRTEVADLHRQIRDLQTDVQTAREDFRATFETQEERHREENRAQEDRHRAESRAQEERHREELRVLHGRLERESLESWRLRQLATRKGIDPDTGEDIGKMREDEHGAAGVGTE